MPAPQIDAEFLGLTPEDAEKLQAQIVREFALWADTPVCDADRVDNFYKLQQLTFLSYAMNGDAIVLLPTKEQTGQPYSLRVRLVEADRVCSPDGFDRLVPCTVQGHDVHCIVQGVETDADGMVVAYWVCDRHPLASNAYTSGGPHWTRVEAYTKTTGRRNVLHVMNRERAGQRRGVPMLAPVLEALKQLGRYTDAEITAAVLSAMFTVFVKQGVASDARPFGEMLPPDMLIEKYGLTVYDGKAEQEDKTSMNISITKKTSTHNTTAAAGRAIRYIVVHYTAGVTSKPGSAAGTASYFGSTSKQVSADFIVDDGGAVQYNGDIRNRYTWHCGGGKYNTKGGAYYGKATNRNTIGIEVCSTNDTGKMTVANDSHWRFTDKVVSNLVELVKYLMAEYGIDAAHVIRHYDVNGKPCPGIIGWNEDTGSAAKWAAFKARLGAATPGGQTGGSTNTGTATGNTALTYKVGDIVQFAGGKHYANAQAASGTTVKPGPAKVTAVATAGKHPYHLVHTDSTSTVYGWVDAAAITGKASATPAAKTYTVKAGDSLWRIAAQQLGNGARYKEIKTLNGLKNNTIHAGQVLKLPN